LFCNDRQSVVSGGVLLYIAQDLAAVPCKVMNGVDLDNSLWCMIPLPNNDKLLVEVLYRAPSSSFENNQWLLSIISNLQERVAFTHLLIMGDFNLPSINWAQLECTGGENSLHGLLIPGCCPG